MAKLFDSIKLSRPKRNKFDLSHERKMSLDMGILTPIMCQEIVPGDSFRVRSEILLRMAPMLAPVMHRVNVFTHFFFVPNRLLWDEWEDFITGGREGTTVPVAPHMDSEDMGVADGSLADYLGMPADFGSVEGVPINALPFRAYQLVYDEYYRDQNLTAPLDILKTSGNIAPGAEMTKLMSLRRRAWEKDYFTSALPWAQRGGAVGVPVTGSVGAGTFRTGDWQRNTGGAATVGNMQIAGGGLSVSSGEPGVGIGSDIVGSGSLTNASVTINELRRSSRLQEWLEKNARGGARYVEQILSHFGVKSSDARLQRPEYLGGGKQPIVISEVLSTVGDFTEPVPQGNMSGHGVSFGTSNGFKRGFEEHGFVIGLMSVLPKTAYQQGLPKMFRRDDKFDYYWPEFANIGEQQVLNSEIYFAADDLDPDAVWGYQSRYAEYKYHCDSVHGDFKNSLAFWHMGRIFATPPVLNTAFIEADPTERIFAVTDPVADKLYCQVFNRVDALRPMPYFGTPML